MKSIEDHMEYDRKLSKTHNQIHTRRHAKEELHELEEYANIIKKKW